MPSRAAYLRADAWLADLRALHAQGLSDRAIARELSRRYPHLTFTKWRVFRWRVTMIESGPTGRLRDYRSLKAARQSAARVYQTYRGFSDLLPGVELTPRQTDILALVRDCGSLSRPEIARKLGRHPYCYLWMKKDECPVHALLNLGLLTGVPGPRPRKYTLALPVGRRVCCG
jgi:hypothetical protein